MSANWDVLTFDCYGTLVDWDGGISQAFLNAAAADGVQLDREVVLERYSATEPQVQAEAFRSYREVLTEAALRVAAELGWSINREQAQFLPESLANWRPFEDTNAALEQLRASGCRLGILSNIDDDLIRGTLQHLTVSFDTIITAEQVRSYKPAHGHFLAARERFCDARWMHVAQSYFHDVVPAVELGIPVTWINRKDERASGDAQPDHELPDLAALAALSQR